MSSKRVVSNWRDVAHSALCHVQPAGRRCFGARIPRPDGHVGPWHEAGTDIKASRASCSLPIPGTGRWLSRLVEKPLGLAMPHTSETPEFI